MSSSSRAGSPSTRTGAEKVDQRARVSLSFSPEEMEQVREMAGAMPLAAWCKERVILSNGFADPTASLISQGLMTAANLRQHQYLYIEVFELGYQLAEAIDRRPLGSDQDEDVRALVDRLNGTLSALSKGREPALRQREELVTVLKALVDGVALPARRGGVVADRP